MFAKNWFKTIKNTPFAKRLINNPDKKGYKWAIGGGLIFTGALCLTATIIDRRQKKEYKKTLLDDVTESKYRKVKQTLKDGIKYGININDIKNYQGQNLLHLAVLSDTNVNLVKLILKTPIDINAVSNNNDTALIMASWYSRCGNNIAFLLIDSKADVNIKGRNGETALMKAIYYNNINLVTKLLDAGASVGIKDDKGQTALDYCIDKPELFDIIYRRTKKISNDHKEQILIAAIQKGNDKIAVQLINDCTRYNKKDEYGLTALDYIDKMSNQTSQTYILDAINKHQQMRKI